MEIVSSITGKIVDCMFDAAHHQIGYLLHYNDNIEALSKQAKKLAGTKDRVLGEIDAGRRNREHIEIDVQNWISEVDTITAEVETVLDDDVKANKKCLGGWCINLRTRYRFSKEAQQKTLEILRLQEEGKFKNVSRPATPSGSISLSKGIFRAFESRKSIMSQIMEVLNEENVSIIGICGMGGVGKTTLVKEIGKEVQENKLFDEVLMVTVSQTVILMKIQEELASKLGLTLLGNMDESRRVSLLWDRIKAEKRILVILDDVWERIDLEKVGIPFGLEHKGCKILLTSRSQGVCDQMDAQKIFTLQTLSDQESWLFFMEAAGLVDNADINPIAREVAAKCGGLPIAILTLGRALRKKDKYMWDDAAQQLKKSTLINIEGMHKKVVSSLELSYNYLENEEAKSLFLFCCLFPEDFNIQIEALIRYGMGLRWFKDVDTVEEARLRTHAVVSSLISSFLLIAGDEETCVKMHDMVRDFALAIASKHNNTFMVKVGIGLKVWPSRDSYEDLTAISLMLNKIREMPDGLNCPKLQVLLLQENSSLVIHDLIFQGMKDLNVLDLSDTILLSLPHSLSFLANLRSLCLKNCLLGDLSLIGNLSNLEILNLSCSRFEDIPLCFSLLSHLRLLDLDCCVDLRLISHGVISCLDKLEELYMIHSFSNWDCENNARIVELVALSRLTNLVIKLPSSNYLPKLKPFENLNRFTISLGISWWNFDEKMSYSEKNYMRRMGLLHNMNYGPLLDWVKYLLKRSEALFLYEIIGIEKVQDDLLNEEGFTELKFLILERNHGIKHLLNTLEWAPTHATFNNLEVLRIFYNCNFVEICHGQEVPAQSFSKLKELLVSKCERILNIVPAHLLQRLKKLECCEVLQCKSLVHVFDLQGLEIVEEETKFLSSLKMMKLYSLPKMTHIWKGDIGSISLHNLVFVDICDCHKLLSIFTTSIAKRLVLLKTLNVSRCSGMQEILIDDEDDQKEASTEKIVFPNLYSMELKGLDNLTCFCSGQYSIEFPALERLIIDRCPKMKTFGDGDQVTPKLKRMNLQCN